MSIVIILKRQIQSFTSKIINSFQKRNKKIWIFGEWFGERCCDNCFYFVHYLAEKHPELELYWIAKSTCDTTGLPSTVKVLMMDSDICVKMLKRAGAVFVIQGACDLTLGRSCFWGNTVFVNFWHGVPWKIIGNDKVGSNFRRMYYKYWSRRFEPDYFLSTSKEFDIIIKRSFFKNEDDIIKAGYPRNSMFYDKTKVMECRRKLLYYLVQQGANVGDDCRIITYMPTFRDNTAEVFSMESVLFNDSFQSLLERYNAVVVEKNHFVTAQRTLDSYGKHKRFFKLPTYSSQELLAASDLLVTDYSSCFFDYLILDRPIVHFLYDYEYYVNNDRGLYYKKDMVACGDIAHNVEDLIKCLDVNMESPLKCQSLRKERRRKFLEYESEVSCQEIYNQISKKIFR